MLIIKQITWEEILGFLYGRINKYLVRKYLMTGCSNRMKEDQAILWITNIVNTKAKLNHA